jgi:hypothetical protein
MSEAQQAARGAKIGETTPIIPAGEINVEALREAELTNKPISTIISSPKTVTEIPVEQLRTQKAAEVPATPAPPVDLHIAEEKAQAKQATDVKYQAGLKTTLYKTDASQIQSDLDKTTQNYQKFTENYNNTKTSLVTFLNTSNDVIKNQTKYDWSKYPGGFSGYQANVQKAQTELQKLDAQKAQTDKDYSAYVASAKSGIQQYTSAGFALQSITNAPEYVISPVNPDLSGSETRAQEREFTGLSKDELAQYNKIAQLDSLKYQGLLTSSTDSSGKQTYSLTRPVDQLTDAQVASLKSVGFNIPDEQEGLGKMIYEYGKEHFEPTSFLGKESQYYGAIVGDFTKALLAPYRLVASVIPGEQPLEHLRDIDTQNLQYFQDLSPGQKAALGIGGGAATFAGSYLAFLPVGVTLQGASNLAGSVAKSLADKGIEVATPKLISTISSFIQANPKAAQALLWGSMAGYEAGTVYKEMQQGTKPEDIINSAAHDIGNLLGATAGIESGMSLLRPASSASGARIRAETATESGSFTQDTVEYLNKGIDEKAATKDLIDRGFTKDEASQLIKQANIERSVAKTTFDNLVKSGISTDEAAGIARTPLDSPKSATFGVGQLGGSAEGTAITKTVQFGLTSKEIPNDIAKFLAEENPKIAGDQYLYGLLEGDGVAEPAVRNYGDAFEELMKGKAVSSDKFTGAIVDAFGKDTLDELVSRGLDVANMSPEDVLKEVDSINKSFYKELGVGGPWSGVGYPEQTVSGDKAVDLYKQLKEGADAETVRLQLLKEGLSPGASEDWINEALAKANEEKTFVDKFITSSPFEEKDALKIADDLEAGVKYTPEQIKALEKNLGLEADEGKNWIKNLSDYVDREKGFVDSLFSGGSPEEGTNAGKAQEFIQGLQNGIDEKRITLQLLKEGMSPSEASDWIARAKTELGATQSIADKLVADGATPEEAIAEANAKIATKTAFTLGQQLPPLGEGDATLKIIGTMSQDAKSGLVQALSEGADASKLTDELIKKGVSDDLAKKLVDSATKSAVEQGLIKAPADTLAKATGTGTMAKELAGQGLSDAEVSKYVGAQVEQLDKVQAFTQKAMLEGMSEKDAMTYAQSLMTIGPTKTEFIVANAGNTQAFLNAISYAGIAMVDTPLGDGLNAVLKATGMTQIEINRAMPALVNPTVDNVIANMPALSDKALSLIVPTMTAGEINAMLPKLSDTPLSRIVPNLSPDTISKVIINLDTPTLNKFIVDVDADTLNIAKNKLDFDTINDVVQKVDVDLIPKVIDDLDAETITSILEKLDVDTIELVLPKLTTILTDPQLSRIEARIGQPAMFRIKQLQDQQREEQKKDVREDEPVTFFVKFQYPNAQEKVTVQAKNFHSALIFGLQNRKSGLPPKETMITRQS